MKQSLSLVTALTVNLAAVPLAAEEASETDGPAQKVSPTDPQAQQVSETASTDADSQLEMKIAKLYTSHRNLAISAYVGFLVSDISGIAAAVMLHRDRTDSTGYDVLRYGHWVIGSLSILTYIPQTITAWRMMAIKQKLGMEINRRHKITSLLTTLGVLVEIAGITTLAVMGAKDSPHFKTMTSVHCAASTLLVMVPFTISGINSRPRGD